MVQESSWGVLYDYVGVSPHAKIEKTSPLWYPHPEVGRRPVSGPCLMSVWVIDFEIQLGRDIPCKLGSLDCRDLIPQECRPTLERVPWFNATMPLAVPNLMGQSSSQKKHSQELEMTRKKCVKAGGEKNTELCAAS